MSDNDDKSDLVNFSYVAEEKTEKIKSVLFNFVERQKNFYRLNTIGVNECAKRCLDNFKTNKLSSQETMCLTVCTEKFYDMLDIGENVYDHFNKGLVDSTAMINGEFHNVVNKI